MTEKCERCQREDEHNHGILHYEPTLSLYDRVAELLTDDIWNYESMNSIAKTYIYALPDAFHQ